MLHPEVSYYRLNINEPWTEELKLEGLDIDRVNTAPIRFYVGLEGSAIEELIETFDVILKGKFKTSFPLTLQCFLHAVASIEYSQSERVINGFLISFDTAHKEPPARYKSYGFATRTFANTLERLEQHGYVEIHKGARSSRNPDGLLTLCIPTEKAYKWVRDNIDNLSLKSLLSENETVVLKHTKQELAQLKKNKKKVSPLKEYEDNAFTNQARHSIELTNKHRVSFEWGYITSEEDHEATTFSRVVIPSDDLYCRRVFNGNFESGGRFYCSIQSIKKSERATMLIDGEPCVEADIKTLHPRMLYNMTGLEAPVDSYNIPNFDKAERPVFKHISNVLINASNMSVAKANIANEFGLEGEEVNKYVEAFCNYHEPIQQWFGRGKWKELHFRDSQLTERILLKALELNMPLLPVHDSYITTLAFKERLVALIQEAYKAEFGFPCLYTVEFSESFINHVDSKVTLQA